MEINVKDAVYLGTQVLIVVVMVSNNRAGITHLKQQNDELKLWFKDLQDKVNDIRAKVGV